MSTEKKQKTKKMNHNEGTSGGYTDERWTITFEIGSINIASVLGCEMSFSDL